MTAQITIRDVPAAVRDELAAWAALQGKSMQEYLRAELERLAARPQVEKVLAQIRERRRQQESDSRRPRSSLNVTRTADERRRWLGLARRPALPPGGQEPFG
jgi:antitoxin FitA